MSQTIQYPANIKLQINPATDANNIYSILSNDGLNIVKKENNQLSNNITLEVSSNAANIISSKGASLSNTTHSTNSIEAVGLNNDDTYINTYSTSGSVRTLNIQSPPVPYIVGNSIANNTYTIGGHYADYTDGVENIKRIYTGFYRSGDPTIGAVQATSQNGLLDPSATKLDILTRSNLDFNGTKGIINANNITATTITPTTITDINTSTGNTGQMLSSTGSGIDWVDYPSLATVLDSSNVASGTNTTLQSVTGLNTISGSSLQLGTTGHTTTLSGTTNVPSGSILSVGDGTTKIYGGDRGNLFDTTTENNIQLRIGANGRNIVYNAFISSAIASAITLTLPSVIEDTYVYVFNNSSTISSTIAGQTGENIIQGIAGTGVSSITIRPLQTIGFLQIDNGVKYNAIINDATNGTSITSPSITTPSIDTGSTANGITLGATNANAVIIVPTIKLGSGASVGATGQYLISGGGSGNTWQTPFIGSTGLASGTLNMNSQGITGASTITTSGAININNNKVVLGSNGSITGTLVNGTTINILGSVPAVSWSTSTSTMAAMSTYNQTSLWTYTGSIATTLTLTSSMRATYIILIRNEGTGTMTINSATANIYVNSTYAASNPANSITLAPTKSLMFFVDGSVYRLIGDS